MDHPLLKDEANKEIIGLLSISTLPVTEKRLWLAALPELTPAEKAQLKKNLEEEVAYEIEVEEKALTQFIKAFGGAK